MKDELNRSNISAKYVWAKTVCQEFDRKSIKNCKTLSEYNT